MKAWTIIGFFFVALALLNVSLVVAGREPFSNGADAAMCAAFAVFAFRSRRAEERHAIAAVTANVSKSGEVYGRRVELKIAPPEADMYRQFRLALLVDGKERYAAFYTDKREDYEECQS